MHNELELILSRILPLRKTGGQIDKLVFLGNYMGSTRSHETIDLLIKTKTESPEQVQCLLGNKDLQLIESMNQNCDAAIYSEWLSSGGDVSLTGYLSRNNLGNSNPYLITRQYIKRFIPKEHIDFINLLLTYYETDDYIFVHGGCDPNIQLNKQNKNVLVSDRSVFNLVCNAKNFKCPWKKTIITGGIGKSDGKPLVRDKFITLDGSYAERLYVIELNSMEIFSARKGKARLVKESIT